MVNPPPPHHSFVNGSKLHAVVPVSMPNRLLDLRLICSISRKVLESVKRLPTEKLAGRQESPLRFKSTPPPSSAPILPSSASRYPEMPTANRTEEDFSERDERDPTVLAIAGLISTTGTATTPL
ncbi:MAG: hypothetical protein TREMPRED_004186, partial [Tremellales sp. Tagirdzhanova-0007]